MAPTQITLERLISTKEGNVFFKRISVIIFYGVIALFHPSTYAEEAVRKLIFIEPTYLPSA